MVQKPQYKVIESKSCILIQFLSYVIPFLLYIMKWTFFINQNALSQAYLHCMTYFFLSGQFAPSHPINCNIIFIHIWPQPLYIYPRTFMFVQGLEVLWKYNELYNSFLPIVRTEHMLQIEGSDLHPLFLLINILTECIYCNISPI